MAPRIIRIQQSLKVAAEAADINGLYGSIKEDPHVLDRIDAIPFVDTPLHIAASAGHTDFAIEILRLKPSFGRKLNPDGLSSLHLALISDKFETVKRLIDFGKELIRVKGKEGITPLHFIAKKDINAEQQHREEDPRLNILAEFLLACPDSIEDLTIRNETVLHIAVKTKNQGAVEVILGCIRRMNKKRVLANKDMEGNTALHIAVNNKQPEMVKLLVTGFLAYINEKNSEGKTALDIALSLGTDEAARIIESSLSGAGALESSSLDYSLARFDLNVALMVAAKKGDINGLYGLLERAPKVLDDIDALPFVDTPLHTAASAGHTDFAIEILRLMPSFGRKLNPRGESSLHLALINKKFEMVKRLIKFDKELIRVKGRERTTPLHVLVNNDIYGDQADEEQRVTDEQERVADDRINIWFEFLFGWRNSIEDQTIRDDPINADQQQRGTDEQQRVADEEQRVTDEQKRVVDDRTKSWFEFLFGWRNSIEDQTIRDDPINADQQQRVADVRIKILVDRDDPINADQQQRGTDEQQRALPNMEQVRVAVEQERLANDRIDILAEFLFACPNSVEDLTIQDETALHIAVKSKNQKAVAIILGCICRIGRKRVLDYKDKEGNTALQVVSDSHMAVSDSERVIARSLCCARVLECSSSPDPSDLAEFLNSPEQPLEVVYKHIIRVRRSVSMELRNIGLVVAVLIATATFQAVLSPPGGVGGPGDNNLLTNGTSINATISSTNHLFAANTSFINTTDELIGYGQEGYATYGDFFVVFYGCNTMALVLSMLMIMFALPFQPFFPLHLALYFLMLSYGVSFSVISPSNGSAEVFRKVSTVCPRMVEMVTENILITLLGPQMVIENILITLFGSTNGIQCGERDMELVHGSKREVDLVKRRRLKAGKVATSDIKTLVKSLVGKKNKTKEDIEDVAKLLCMFLCVTFLFSTSGNTLSWAHIQYLDDLNEMKEYDWAYEVLESLIQSIEKHRRTPRKVTGCVNLLLYWFCEHTKVIETIEGEEIPRLLKWNITDMQKKHEQNSFDENQYDVVLAAINPTPDECELYGIDIARKNEEHAESSGSEDDNVGGSDDNEDEDEEDEEDEEEVEEKEEEEANDTNQLEESQPELTVRLGDTPKESVDIAKEPVLKSLETATTTSSGYQTTTTTSPMETVVPETPFLSPDTEGLNPKEHDYVTGLCTKITKPTSLHSGTSAANKSQDDSLLVVELQKKLEVMQVQKEKIEELLKEALAREKKLLEHKQEATKRVEEVLNKLKEALERQEDLLKEKDGTTKKIEELQKKLEQVELQRETIQGILKEALERERRLLNDKHKATNRVDELEKILNNTNKDSMEVQLQEAQEKIQNLLAEREKDRVRIENLEKEKAEKETLAREETLASATKEEENTRLQEQKAQVEKAQQERVTEMAVHEITQKAEQDKCAQEEKGKAPIKNSMFEHVKARKRKGIELNDYEYPVRIGKRQKEYEELMNAATSVSIKSPECPIRPKSKYHAVYNKLPQESKIIDSYAEVLVRKQNMEPSYALLTPSGTCYVFTGHILQMISAADDKKVKRIFDKAMTENKAKTSRYLLFPIYHSQHWTLLVLDQTEGTWKFYNSIRPRIHGRDFHCEEAARMQKCINAYLRNENQNLKDNITKVKNSPQQSVDSLDCGVLVCYIIRQYVKNEQVEESISKEQCDNLRAEMLTTFLTDYIGTN
ncbi:hypothetical protein Vadar_009442 [Vaccinium darrowii]|uniref:Uncharacterized protein n=1 Tax=Vaccinium darrowii TaxID=229202 RepID=A0ACB7ZJK6_9ERIC|nr:hypothetical protein Vadar_009442 [Vaccinium darrowii]